MQVTIYSEDYPQGQTANWPVIPQVGAYIEYSHVAGINRLRVSEVVFHANADGSFHSVIVHLSYDDERKQTFSGAPPID